MKRVFGKLKCSDGKPCKHIWEKVWRQAAKLITGSYLVAVREYQVLPCIRTSTNEYKLRVQTTHVERGESSLALSRSLPPFSWGFSRGRDPGVALLALGVQE